MPCCGECCLDPCQDCKDRCAECRHTMKTCGHRATILIVLLVIFLIGINLTTAVFLWTRGHILEEEEEDEHMDTGQNATKTQSVQNDSIQEFRYALGPERYPGTYLFAYGRDFGPYIYTDDSGNQHGFLKDILAAVCDHARIECRAVYEKPSNCWQNAPEHPPALGIGLQGGYYDGCIGWEPTVERERSAKFSKPFTKRLPAHFWVKAVSPFTAADFSWSKIGFLTSSAEDERCLLRQRENSPGLPLSPSQIVHADDVATLHQLLKNGTVDAVFGSDVTLSSWTSDISLSRMQEPELQCGLEGLSLMMQADSHFPTIWNTAFRSLVNSGTYEDLCRESQEKYKSRGNISCIDLLR